MVVRYSTGGQSISQAKMCLGLKYAWGQSEYGAKLGVSPRLKKQLRKKNFLRHYWLKQFIYWKQHVLNHVFTVYAVNIS